MGKNKSEDDEAMESFASSLKYYGVEVLEAMRLNEVTNLDDPTLDAAITRRRIALIDAALKQRNA